MEVISTSGALASALQNLQLNQHRILESPSPHEWSGWLSVCRTQLFYVVVDGTRSMDIFDHDGHHIRHIELSYEPTYSHAITVTASGHLLVAEDSVMVKDVILHNGGQRNVFAYVSCSRSRS